MAKLIAAEKIRIGLRHAMPERDRKDQGEDRPRQACLCWFARHIISWLATNGANLYQLGVFFWFPDQI